MTRKIDIVMDGQFGSTGKGLLSGFLSTINSYDTICTAWAANAGHTFINGNGRVFVHTMLANGVVGRYLKRIMLGAGSIIDPWKLQSEIEACSDLLENVKICIHPNAAIISQENRDEEDRTMVKIGSTRKGCGAAAIQRIRRDPENMNVAMSSKLDIINQYVITAEQYQKELDDSENILIEGAQGYSLSMYHGMYPYTTSRDVSTHQVLADCCIPFNFADVKVYGCYRTYPIRVANRFDEKGNQIGYSGDCYPDQREIEWEELGLAPELTTVTRLPRRIFTFSNIQLAESVRMLGVGGIFLNFVNYLDNLEEIRKFVANVEMKSGVIVEYVGMGANVRDVVSRGELFNSKFNWNK